MKTIKRTFIILSTFLLSTTCYAQFGEFSTPEGFRWGMTRYEVSKLNFGTPTTFENEKIYYYDKETTNSLTYLFVNDKLNAITKKYGYKSEYDMNLYYDIYKKQLINLYGTNYTEIADKSTMQWIYKNTRILLFKSTTDNALKIFINYKKL